MMAAWVRYAAVSVLVVLVLAAGVVGLLDAADGPSVWVAAVVACGVQLAVFALLVRSRRRGGSFLRAWGGGIALRFLAVAGMAAAVTHADALHAESALLGLIAFAMVLALIEPLFLGMAD